MNWKNCLTANLLALATTTLVSLSASAATTDSALIERGKYLAKAGDCAACHSLPGGKPFAGGLALPTPIGAIIATNITPSKSAGIGNYTLEQFSNALRKGIRADGQHLYPAMPYTAYAKVNDDDISALYAYFMNDVAPVDVAAPATHLPFPFDIRLSMAGWNALYLDKKPFQPDAGQSEQWNRGAYLTQGLAHCGTCHTPRNPMMAEIPSRALVGGDVGTWHAPNITSDVNSGVGGWSNEELVQYLKTGESLGKGQAAGPMAEAVDHSLQYLSDADLNAIAVYLKSVPAVRNKADTLPVYARGPDTNRARTDELDSIRSVALPQDPSKMSGAQIYDAYCGTCHQAQGQGSFDSGLPSLSHNTALGRSDTRNLVMVILDGIRRQGDGSDVKMAGFANALNDQQVVTLVQYLTQHYGNPNAKVTLEQVKNQRAGGAPNNLVAMAQGAVGVGGLVVLALIAFCLRRKRKPS